MSRLIVGPYLLAVTVFFTGCGREGGKIESSTAYKQNEINAILACPKRRWDPGERITLFFAIANGTQNTVRMDGRMLWPGNITLWVQLPSSKKVPVLSTAVKLSQPAPNQVLELASHRLCGRELYIDMDDKDVIRELRHSPPGKYSFWVEFFGYPNTDVGLKSLPLTTDYVTLEME